MLLRLMAAVCRVRVGRGGDGHWRNLVGPINHSHYRMLARSRHGVASGSGGGACSG